ncbi:MAG: PAC2 family protein [Anaerolineae bacterium]|jgi:proteasome assembly chaperone (PAC2) family protein|nr:PAC2 family protein [Anaerolineae bacterium]
MNDAAELWEKPPAGRYLIAGWNQWADAGAVSSGLAPYLIELTQARQIGEIQPDGFYLFQIPGTHDLLRPVVKLNDGYREGMEWKRNEFYYAGDEDQGFYIFIGEEPHYNEDLYADAFFDVVEELGIKRVVATAGVYGAVPYEKDREVSCVYSLPSMKEELTKYGVKFSNYEGGATISMYLADRAEDKGIEFFRFCAFVPSYDLSQVSMAVQPIAIAEDYKAWYDLMVRLKHMFKLTIDLSDLQNRGDELISEWDSKIDQVAEAMPHLGVKAYLEEISSEFTERHFMPLSDVWEEELKDLLDDF